MAQKDSLLLSDLGLIRLRVARQAGLYAEVTARLAGIEGVSSTACFEKLAPKFEDLNIKILEELELEE